MLRSVFGRDLWYRQARNKVGVSIDYDAGILITIDRDRRQMDAIMIEKIVEFLLRVLFNYFLSLWIVEMIMIRFQIGG